MTIAAAFRCSDGVVLCADSQMTAVNDGMKYNAQKLFSYSTENVDSVFAFAGAETFSKMCIERLSKVVEVSNPSTIEVNLRNEALAIHQEYAPQALATNPAEYDLNVFLAVRFYQNRASLFHIEGPAVSPPISTYDCIGIGRTVARQSINLFHKNGLSLWEAVRVAVYCLKQTKEHIEACGGPSQVIALWDDSKDEFVSASPYTFEGNDILEIERGFTTLFDALRPVFLSFNDTYPHDTEFDKHLKTAAKVLKRAWREGVSEAQRLQEKQNKKILERFVVDRKKS
jgi:20S proteasome alpha/beta subunit